MVTWYLKVVMWSGYFIVDQSCKQGFKKKKKHLSQSPFTYLLRIITSLHKLGDWHAACALPFVRGWRGGGAALGSCGRVSLRACGCLGFFTGFFSSSRGEVGPLAGHWKSLLTKTGQNLLVHIPAASPVGWTLFINSIVLDEASQLHPDQSRRERKNLKTIQLHHTNINVHTEYYIYCSLTIALPAGNVFCWVLRAGQNRRRWGGGLLATKLPKLIDDHFATVEIAMQKRQELTEYCPRREY